MSETPDHALVQAVENALSTALAKEGAMLTGFLGMVSYIDAEGERCWSVMSPLSQSVSTDLGMAHVTTLTVEGWVNAQIVKASE